MFRECEYSSDKKSWEKSINSVDNYHNQEDSSYFVGKYISVHDTKDQVQKNVVSIDDIDDIKSQLSDLKNINAILKAELHSSLSTTLGYILDTTYLAMDTSLYIHRDSVAKYFVAKGTKSSDSTLWYEINLTLGDSLKIDSLIMREKIDAILAYKRPKWWKAKEPIVRIQSYNPYTKIGNVNNLVVEDEKSKFVKVLTSKPIIAALAAALGYSVGRIQGH